MHRHFAQRLHHQRFGWAGPNAAQIARYPRFLKHHLSRAANDYERRAFHENSAAPTSNVLAEARRYLGRGNVTGSHRAWCADFVNMVLRQTGHLSSSSGMPQSLLSVGTRTSTPRPGDLVVMRGHVTIFAGYGGRGFVGLGGNQHHRVALSNFSLRSVVAFVRPNERR
jgi:uncharacterized protein (TIGR02594 family)